MIKSVEQKIKFHFLVPAFYFPKRAELKQFLAQQLTDGGKSIDAVNYIFCDDDYLLQINKQYLKHYTYTDIITFELSPKGEALLADVYISIPRIRENATLYKTSFKQELHRVIFHGALHLLGYKDKTKEDSLNMRIKEDLWLKNYVPREKTTKKD